MTIEEGVFEKANTTSFPTYTGEDAFVVTGMEGINTLSDRLFANNLNAFVEIPSLTEINDNAFVQDASTGWNQANYAVLYTKNGNKHKLDNREHSYLIDPAKVLVRNVAKGFENGISEIPNKN